MKESKGGWSYYMMDETGGKRRKRRRKASNLADDLTKDSIEERFKEKQAERQNTQPHQNAPESRFETSDDKVSANERETPLNAVETVFDPLGEDGQKALYEAPMEPQRRSTLLDRYRVDVGDIRDNMDALSRAKRQYDDPIARNETRRLNSLFGNANDVRRDSKPNPLDIAERLQDEVDKCREEFRRSQQALQAMGRGKGSSFRMLNKMFCQMMRSMDTPADRMIADMMAQMMAMLWQMEQERIERERREALEQDLYEKRGAMWDAEKRLKAANDAILREKKRASSGSRRVSDGIQSVFDAARRKKEEEEQYER